jgi:hypothetical protein
VHDTVDHGGGDTVVDLDVAVPEDQTTLKWGDLQLVRAVTARNRLRTCEPQIRSQSTGRLLDSRDYLNWGIA